MSPDDMARELRAAGLVECSGGWWSPGDCYVWKTEEAWKELAQQRERGTVQTPVVGTEEKR